MAGLQVAASSRGRGEGAEGAHKLPGLGSHKGTTDRCRQQQAGSGCCAMVGWSAVRGAHSLAQGRGVDRHAGTRVLVALLLKLLHSQLLGLQPRTAEGTALGC